MPLLIIRPQPGAAKTAALASALGLNPVTVPLFTTRPLAWDPPSPDRFDAVMLTSAQAARLAGPALANYLPLPCYCVGESTAAAARGAGFADVRCGAGDGRTLLAAMTGDGVKRALHLCGRNRRAYEGPGIAIERQPVYAVEGGEVLPAAAGDAMTGEAVVLLHSPRAAAHFATLCEHAGLDRHKVSIAAISHAAANAAGTGWKRIGVAERPRDEPLLELAAKLCKTGAA
jgi:uroporphyrinogen-III synthase